MILRAAIFLLALVCGQAFAAADTDAPVSGGEPFTREALISQLTRDLTAHYSLEGELSVELLRPWIPPAKLASGWTVIVLEYPTTPASSMLLRCRILADGLDVAETTLVIRAALWRDVWATRAPLSIGGAFDPALLEARRVDLLRERDALPCTIGDRSYVFARGVVAGRLLTWRDIARRPLVKKGDLVEVSASDGVLTVTMKGVAMQNGAQGETVTVRNPESRRDFAALVIDENRVQVRF